MSNLQMTVSSPNLDEQIAKLANYDPIMRIHLTDAMSKAVQLIETGAKDNAPVFTSTLRRSIYSKVNTDVGSEITGEVGSNLDSIYPAVMELGRAPGTMPPVEALKRWVYLKLGIPENQAISVAFLIARSIARKGIAPRAYLTTALAQAWGAIEMLWQDMADKITEALKVNGS